MLNNDFHTTPPFSLEQDEKQLVLNKHLNELTLFHYNNCENYHKILDVLNIDPRQDYPLTKIPYIPVRLFKAMELLSIPRDSIFKTMTSSGTTGQAVSKIYLDKKAASNQQKTLVKIVADFMGSSRLPMLVIDCPSVVKDRKKFSARGAGILGFSILGANLTYALDDDLNLDLEKISSFLERHRGKNILLFGFTYMVWKHFYKALINSSNNIDLSNGILIHGGGWKKLQDDAVSRQQFKQALTDVCGITQVHNYYGMIEQTGTIYMECEHAHLHASIYSDIIIRNPRDFSQCAVGQKGVVQVVSVLPESYPGHSLLTEDEGVLLGIDDCPCGRKGKYFSILGRIKSAEVRGCSDTYERR